MFINKLTQNLLPYIILSCAPSTICCTIWNNSMYGISIFLFSCIRIYRIDRYFKAFRDIRIFCGCSRKSPGISCLCSIMCMNLPSYNQFSIFKGSFCNISLSVREVVDIVASPSFPSDPLTEVISAVGISPLVTSIPINTCLSLV